MGGGSSHQASPPPIATPHQYAQQHHLPYAPPRQPTNPWPLSQQQHPHVASPHLPVPNQPPATAPTQQQTQVAAATPAHTSRRAPSATDVGVQACFRFRFEDLRPIVSNESNVVGEGGFGKVYKGPLPDGTWVAVKRLDELSMQGDREFYAEVALLGRLRHPNLVPLMGIVDEEVGQKLLVFEYMARGSLRSILDSSKANQLSWGDRMTIALGAARGLAFLHDITSPTVVHCDFKSPNVLVDGYGQARVADFGLSRFIGQRSLLQQQQQQRQQQQMGQAHPQQQQQQEVDVTTVTSVRGTFGYLSPEFLEKGHASVKADVYAFGVVLLELITGLQVVDTSRGKGRETLAEYMAPTLQNDQLNQLTERLDGRMPDRPHVPVLQLAAVAEIAAACLQRRPRDRPTMLSVAQLLSKIIASGADSQQPEDQQRQQQEAAAPERPSSAADGGSSSSSPAVAAAPAPSPPRIASQHPASASTPAAAAAPPTAPAAVGSLCPASSFSSTTPPSSSFRSSISAMEAAAFPPPRGGSSSSSSTAPQQQQLEGPRRGGGDSPNHPTPPPSSVATAAAGNSQQQQQQQQQRQQQRQQRLPPIGPPGISAAGGARGLGLGVGADGARGVGAAAGAAGTSHSASSSSSYTPALLFAGLPGTR